LLRFLEDNSREAANRTVILKRKACNDPDGAPYDKRYVQFIVDWLSGLLTTAKIHFFPSRRQVVTVRYLNDSKRQLFSKFKEAHPGAKLGMSTFYTLIPEYYKEPSKATDLCNVCEAGKHNEARLRRMEQQQSGSEASDEQRDAFKRLQRCIHHYQVHKRLANVQRECYNSEVVSRTRHWCS